MGVFTYFLLLGLAVVHTWKLLGDQTISTVSKIFLILLYITNYLGSNSVYCISALRPRQQFKCWFVFWPLWFYLSSCTLDFSTSILPYFTAVDHMTR